METFQFLSSQWIEAAHKLRADHINTVGNSEMPRLKINLVVTGAPFSEEPIDAHLDTSEGLPEIELGHLDKTDLNVTVDYATAKQIFIDGKISAAMEAMQLGRLKVKGNMLKMMSLTRLRGDAKAETLAKKIRDITE